MTVSSTTVDLSSFTTDAKFRTWVAACEAALAAAGLVQTSDTGQINPATVTKPTATQTKAGYSIWRFNDSLQATYPIFIRVDYGSGGVTSGNSPSTWLTVGTGTDGAGSITGVGFANTQTYSGTQTVTNTSSLVAAAYSTAAGAAALVLGAQTASALLVHGGLWVVARTTDSTGAPTGDGVVVSHLNSGGVRAGAASFSPANTYAATNPGCGVLSNQASMSTGSEVQLYRHYALIPSPKPVMGTVSYYISDITSLSTFMAAPFGSTSRTYMALGGWASGASASQDANIRLAVIWE